MGTHHHRLGSTGQGLCQGGCRVPGGSADPHVHMRSPPPVGPNGESAWLFSLLSHPSNVASKTLSLPPTPHSPPHHLSIPAGWCRTHHTGAPSITRVPPRHCSPTAIVSSFPQAAWRWLEMPGVQEDPGLAPPAAISYHAPRWILHVWVQCVSENPLLGR